MGAKFARNLAAVAGTCDASSCGMVKTQNSGCSGWVSVVLSVSLGAFAVGCTAQVYSPPSRMPSLESAATLGEGRVAVTGRGGVHGGDFGGTLVNGAGKVRYGVAEQTDIYGEGTVMAIARDEGTDYDNPSRAAVAIQGGAKHQFTNWLAVHGGIGGGVHGFGGFIAPEVGAVVAYENPYFVPFADFTLAASIPLGARTRLLRYDREYDSKVERHEPNATGYGTVTAGFRVPITFSEGSSLHEINILGGLSLTYATSDGSRTADVDSAGVETAAADYTSNMAILGLMGGAEFVF
jgi:hypothetical protein